jgi:hypothetical protein
MVMVDVMVMFIHGCSALRMLFTTNVVFHVPYMAISMFIFVIS